MRTTIVLNPHAGSAQRKAAALREQAERFGWDLCETHGEGHASKLARDAADAGVDRVLAAGGDGTISQVVQGLMSGEHRPVFGVVPMGTGNDFARTLRMPQDVAEACEWLADCPRETGRTDLLKVRSEKQRAWALNAVNGGLANQVRRSLDEDQKRRWGPLAFVLTGLEVAGSDVPAWDVDIRLDGGPWQTLREVACLTVANARSAGGGFEVAPSADIEDGEFDLVTISSERVLGLAEVAVRAKLGWIVGSEQVEHTLGRSLEVRCPDDFCFTVDGEEFVGRQVSVAVCRAALPFVAGPDYARTSHVGEGAA